MTYSLPDLHPDDRTARLAIGTRLFALRRAAGLSRERLGDRIGISKGSVQALEISRDGRWMIGSMQRWARALGQRATFTIDGLPGRAPNLLADLYTVIRPDTVADVDELERARLRLELARARRALHITAAELAGRMGLAAGSVGPFERDGIHFDIALHTCQRYARALGGRVIPDLEPDFLPAHRSALIGALP